LNGMHSISFVVRDPTHSRKERSTSMRTAWICVLCLLGISDTLAAAAFLPLGFPLDGDNPTSGATDVSFDGSVVVGWAAAREQPESRGREAFRWTRDGGMSILESLPGYLGRYPTALSADGSVVVGGLAAFSKFDAFRWTAESGLVLWNGPRPSDVSADGNVMVGEGNSLWTVNDGWTDLGEPPCDCGVGGSGISADGTVIVGSFGPWHGYGSEPFRWTHDGGIVSLGNSLGGYYGSANAVSADGQIIVGQLFNRGEVASGVVWTTDGDTEILPQFGEARDVSADGSTIVGNMQGGGALIWDASNGTRSIADVLSSLGVVEHAGWTLYASAISGDGTTIVGGGLNPDGRPEAWLARIEPVPEPSTFVLMGLALMTAGACRWKYAGLTTRRPA
jgi:uncharacterized membrane protein